MRFKYYALDFDLTITDRDCYPDIGNLKEHADRVIRRLKDNGAKIAIWTCRTGQEQEKLVKDFLHKHNIPYDKFNEPFEELTEMFDSTSRKILAEVYIDDRGIYARMNGGIDWLQIEKFLFEES